MITGILWTLLVRFSLRVLGQALVAFLSVPWLPAMEHWYSGLIPYPCLLAAQALIIGLMAWICLDFSRTGGFFYRPRRLFAQEWRWFGYAYLAAMIARALLIGDRPIPIFFHWVLAFFVIVVGESHRRRLDR